jgi:hypothetical protein
MGDRSCKEGVRRTAPPRLVAALLALAAAAAPAGAVTRGWVEEFADDPFADGGDGGPLFERRGPQEAFRWDPLSAPAWEGDAPGSLRARYDTLEPTARAIAPLPRALGRGDSFRVAAAFVIRPEEFFADPLGFAQIAFGLMNRTTTGDDRTGDPDDIRADTFDALEFDYFANVSPFFGGPFAGGAAFGGAAGDDAFLNFAFATVALALPLGEPLEASLVHRPSDGVVEIQVSGIEPDGARRPLLAEPVLVRAGSLTPGFALDAVGIFVYHDGYNVFSGSGRSLRADVDFHRLEVRYEEPVPVEAEILPGTLFLRSRLPFVSAALSPLDPDDAGALAALEGESPAIELWAEGRRLAAALRAVYDDRAGALIALFDADEVRSGLGDLRGEVEVEVRGEVEGSDTVRVIGRRARR